MVAANVAKISSQTFRAGTSRLDFENFGAQSSAVLHGPEAVIPKGGGHLLAGEIAAAMSGMKGGRGGGGPGGGDIFLDGKKIGEWLESRSKSGNIRTHPSSVRPF